MLSQNLKNSYKNWNDKIDSINTELLIDTFDIFLINYLIFNNLYNEIPERFFNKNIQIPNKMIEEKLASQNVVDYLTSKKINLVLSEKNTPEILKIVDLIKGEKYPIKLFFGKKSRKSDLEILSDLEIGNDKKKSIAILLIIFHVRFNLFKLEIQKTKKEYQREMIDSLNEILITINNTLYQRLLEKN